MILVRFILIGIIIYLLVRSFVRFFAGEADASAGDRGQERKTQKKSGVSKEIGEYVDYEEVD